MFEGGMDFFKKVKIKELEIITPKNLCLKVEWISLILRQSMCEFLLYLHDSQNFYYLYKYL